jgi:hypothetical protein
MEAFTSNKMESPAHPKSPFRENISSNILLLFLVIILLMEIPEIILKVLILISYFKSHLEQFMFAKVSFIKYG